MKKYIFLVGILLIAASTRAQELKLDEVLTKYYKASGFDKLRNVKTIIMSGTMIRNDAMPIKVIRVRPNKYRVENDIMDITGLLVFDGQNAWTTAPWTKDPNPQVPTGPALNDLKFRADFDGIVYDWKAKGHNTELVGVEKVGESDAYKIKLTRSDGAIEFYLIDCKNFLLVRKSSFRNVRGTEVQMDNDFSDYKNVDGIPFSYLSENSMGGQHYTTIQYETIELNKSVDENIFVMPTK